MNKAEWFKNLTETFIDSDQMLRLKTVYHLTRILQGEDFDFVVFDNAGGTRFEIWTNNTDVWTGDDDPPGKDKVRHIIRDMSDSPHCKAYQLDGEFTSKQIPHKWPTGDWIAWKPDRD